MKVELIKLCMVGKVNSHIKIGNLHLPSPEHYAVFDRKDTFFKTILN